MNPTELKTYLNRLVSQTWVKMGALAILVKKDAKLQKFLKDFQELIDF